VALNWTVLRSRDDKRRISLRPELPEYPSLTESDSFFSPCPYRFASETWNNQDPGWII